MRTYILAAAVCAVLALVAAGCGDSDPKRPEARTTTVEITILDWVGDWDNLHLMGDLTGGQPAALTQDGPYWSAEIAGLAAGFYEFAIYHDDGEEAGTEKVLQPVLDDLLVTVDGNLAVTGDLAIDLVPGPETGLNLLVANHDAAYGNVRIRGAMNAWTPDITGHSADGVHWYLHVPAGLTSGNYQWQVLGEDDEQQDQVLSPTAPNLEFSIAVDRSVGGDRSFTIPAPVAVESH